VAGDAVGPSVVHLELLNEHLVVVVLDGRDDETVLGPLQVVPRHLVFVLLVGPGSRRVLDDGQVPLLVADEPHASLAVGWFTDHVDLLPFQHRVVPFDHFLEVALDGLGVPGQHLRHSLFGVDSLVGFLVARERTDAAGEEGQQTTD